MTDVKAPKKAPQQSFRTYSSKLHWRHIPGKDGTTPSGMQYTVSLEQATWFQKQIFIDLNTYKMNYEAKRAVDRVGINPHDLQEKTLEEFKHNAKDENVTDEIIRMRYFHYENRRRKKLKILADYIRNNR